MFKIKLSLGEDNNSNNINNNDHTKKTNNRNKLAYSFILPLQETFRCQKIPAMNKINRHHDFKAIIRCLVFVVQKNINEAFTGISVAFTGSLTLKFYCSPPLRT